MNKFMPCGNGTVSEGLDSENWSIRSIDYASIPSKEDAAGPCRDGQLGQDYGLSKPYIQSVGLS